MSSNVRRLLTSVLLAAAAIAAVGGTIATAKTRSCPAVTFALNSDDGTSRIVAVGVSCSTARAVARGAKSHGPSGTNGTTYHYNARGFSCSGRENDDTLPFVSWHCRHGKQRVTFTRS
jgi:hypothetical protein